MNKSEFIDKLRKGRAEWEALLASIPAEQMSVQGLGGPGSAWTVKDVIAHNTWNEAEMVRMLSTRSLGPSESDQLWEMSNDDRNNVLFERYRDQPLEDVLAEAEETRERLLMEAEKLEDADLNDPSRFENMPGDWQPWRIIAGCTFTHYPDHIADIEAWLSDNQSAKDSN